MEDSSFCLTSINQHKTFCATWPQMAACAMEGRTPSHHIHHVFYASFPGDQQVLGLFLCLDCVNNAAMGIAGVLCLRLKFPRKRYTVYTLAALSAVPPTGSLDVSSPTLASIFAL